MIFLQLASDVSAGGFIKNSHLVMFKRWLKSEAGKSSTWRDIKAVELCLFSFKDVLKGSSITSYTDSQSAATITLKGSKVHELQSLAFTIFEFCDKNDTDSMIHTVVAQGVAFLVNFRIICNHSKNLQYSCL